EIDLFLHDFPWQSNEQDCKPSGACCRQENMGFSRLFMQMGLRVERCGRSGLLSLDFCCCLPASSMPERY
ncbi:hypothetical protein, partial [Nitrosomonas europaea]|uniref:hypothetical protein n=1 Tax=Nitrosomonas europaea TaxID=915 RepID=UPI0023F54EA0